MYFEVNLSVSSNQPTTVSILDAIADAIRRRRGVIVAAGYDLLLFSAPFWRYYGICSHLMQQMPMGMAFGIVDLVECKSSVKINVRVSLFWWRCWTIIFLILLLNAGARLAAEGDPVLGLVVIGLALFTLPAYYIAIVVTRRQIHILVDDAIRVSSSMKQTASK